jgi:hypothetical protein
MPRRTPLWVFVLLVLLIIGIGVYAYFTTPLPLGLSSVVRTPGGANVAAPTPSPAPGARTSAGQTLVLGSTSVVVDSVQRNQDLAQGGRGGPAGVYTVVQIDISNEGSQSLAPQASSFELIDERGRAYAVDLEATRTLNAAARHRTLFDATVPPGGRATTLLAFETAPDANAVSLRVSLGSGDLELPR